MFQAHTHTHLTIIQSRSIVYIRILFTLSNTGKRYNLENMLPVLKVFHFFTMVFLCLLAECSNILATFITLLFVNLD